MKLAREEIIWRVVDGEALLLDSQTGYYFSLDGSGTEIWMLLNEKNSVEEVVAELVKRRSLETETAQHLLSDLVASLKAEAIIDDTTFNQIKSAAQTSQATVGSYSKPVLKKYDQIDHVAIYGLD